MGGYLNPNELIPRELTQNILEKPLRASLSRNLRRHGYEAQQGLLEALSIFKAGGLDRFLESARIICAEFHQLIWNTIDGRLQQLASAGEIKGAWDENYTEGGRGLLAKITPKRRLYLTYGSNMASEQMNIRCPNSKLVGTTYHENWQLMFHRVANIEESQGARTPAVVWDIPQEDEVILDGYEGVPKHYYKQNKQNMLVTLNGTQVAVMAYVMAEWTKNGEPKAKLKPDGGYLSPIHRGYLEHGFQEPVWGAD